MKLTTFAALWATAGADNAFQRTLDAPHKTHTRHRQLCIPETSGIRECEGTLEGEMMQWDEFSYYMSDNEYGSAVFSPSADGLYLKYLKARTTREGSKDMWKAGGIVEENGVDYNQFILLPTDFPLGQEKNVLLETGALPDRLEYLETAGGAPYTMRQYSGANSDMMYVETMFMMAEEIAEEEMERDPREMAMDLAIRMTGENQYIDFIEEDPIPVPRSLRSTNFASQATMPGYYHRNENWMFWDEFSDGEYPRTALSSLRITQQQLEGGALGDIVGLTSFVDRAGHPEFERQVADASDVESNRFDMDVDEWIIEVSGSWYNGAFKKLAFVTNKNRSHEFVSSDKNRSSRAKDFVWSAEEGEAMYGIRAYIEQTQSGTYLRDIKALWGTIPGAESRRLSVETLTKSAARLRLRGARSVQGKVEQRFKLDFPRGCVESDRSGKCLSVFQAETRSLEDFQQVESLSTSLYFRFRADRREAELEGAIETGEGGDIKQLRIAGRGCVTPGEFRIGKLASVSATKCFFGDIAWRSDRTITGRVGASFTLAKEVVGREFSVELSGQGGVRSRTQGRTVQFAGYTGEVSLNAEFFGVIDVGVTGEFEHYPTDIGNQDGWATDISVTPELSVNLFLFRQSVSYTFKIVNIEPESREATDDRFPAQPRPLPDPIPDPDLSHLQFDDYITDLAGVSKSGTHIEEFNVNTRTRTSTAPVTPVSSVEVTQILQATRRARTASRYNNHRDELFSIRTTNKARDDFPSFSRSVGQQAQPGFRRVEVRRLSRVDLDDDEWFIKVSGFWDNGGRSIWQLRLETNKGRISDFAKTSSPPPSRVTNFEFEAPTGYALFGFDGYVERESSRAGSVSIRTDRINDFQVAWGKAPDQQCALPEEDSDLCLPKLVSNDKLRCTNWPSTNGFTTNEERCLLANEQLDNGFQYVYNYNRGTEYAECGETANCWCCRRRVRVVGV